MVFVWLMTYPKKKKEHIISSYFFVLRQGSGTLFFNIKSSTTKVLEH